LKKKAIQNGTFRIPAAALAFLICSFKKIKANYLICFGQEERCADYRMRVQLSA